MKTDGKNAGNGRASRRSSMLDYSLFGMFRSGVVKPCWINLLSFSETIDSGQEGQAVIGMPWFLVHTENVNVNVCSCRRIWFGMLLTE